MAVIIDINYKEATESTQPTQSNNNIAAGTAEKSTSTATKSVASTVGVVMATMAAKQALNYATSNIGKYSGNSRLQQKVNLASSVASTTIGLIGAIATLNPVVIATTVMSTAISIGTDVANGQWQLKMNNLTQQRKRTRAGYNGDGELVGWRH